MCVNPYVWRLTSAKKWTWAKSYPFSPFVANRVTWCVKYGFKIEKMLSCEFLSWEFLCARSVGKKNSIILFSLWCSLFPEHSYKIQNKRISMLQGLKLTFYVAGILVQIHTLIHKRSADSKRFEPTENFVYVNISHRRIAITAIRFSWSLHYRIMLHLIMLIFYGFVFWWQGGLVSWTFI